MPQKSRYDNNFFKLLGRDHHPALVAIVDIYSSELLAYIKGIIPDQELAKEILFDSYQKLWENRKLIAGMENPSAWLYKCARYRSLNVLKQEKKRNTISIENILPLQHPDGIENRMDANELIKQIQSAVDKLPPQMQLMYRLSREQGMNRKEIASKCNVSESTVKNQLTESLRHIRRFMSKHITSFFL